MDHDKLTEELQKLQAWLNGHDPTSEDYGTVLDRFTKLSKLAMEYDDLCDKQLERQDRLQLDLDKQEKEFELKEKEIERKNEIEEMKLKDSADEAAKRRKIEKLQAVWDLGKIALQIGGYGLLIFITKRVEQTAILGQHEWSLITKPKL